MAKPILFLIHGMGAHPTGWSKTIKGQLKSLANGYKAFQEDPALFGTVQIEEIVYDTELNKVLNQFGQSASGLKTFIQSQHLDIGGSTLDNLLDWLSGASQVEQNFFWASAVDVLLFRFFLDVKRLVVARVLDQILTPLEKAQKGGREVSASILAHSLGTSVIHDSLARLATVPISGHPGSMQQIFSNLFMVANVSKVLAQAYPIKDSPVHPGPEGVCDAYFNFRHKWDPFPAVDAFQPPAKWDDYTPVEDLDHFHQLNVHAPEHYLEHPKVHIPIFRQVFGARITKAEAQSAVNSFPTLTGPPAKGPTQVQVDQFQVRYHQATSLLSGQNDPMKVVLMAGQFGGWI